MNKTNIIQTIEQHLLPINVTGGKTRNTTEAYDRILDAVGPARVVMIGEASHGTKEFYRERAVLTHLLMAKKNFDAVIVEADWPDAYRINRYVQQINDRDKSAEEALGDFVRFPRWMWRNDEVKSFVEWLRTHNSKIDDPRKKIGFYGMDLYCLHASAWEVINYLKKVDPPAAERAQKRYESFLQFGENTQDYAVSTAFGMSKSCEAEVLKTLLELRKKAPEYLKKDGWKAEDEVFYAIQNAEVVRDAEEYYRTMMIGGASSWNIRDSHMAKMVGELLDHMEKIKGSPSKIVVWAHNSHLGDARYTDMGRRRGEMNVGQLLRQNYGANTFNIGFTTYTGTVSAASNWDEPRQVMNVRPGRDDSYEGLLHRVANTPEFALVFRKVLSGDENKVSNNRALIDALLGPMLERYIGVIYRPRSEIVSHYSESSLSQQFDAVIHIDKTSFLQPLDDRSYLPEKEDEHVPDTFPFGI